MTATNSGRYRAFDKEALMSLGHSTTLAVAVIGVVVAGEAYAAGGGSAALFEALYRWDRKAVEAVLDQDPSLAAARGADGRSAVITAAYRVQDGLFVAPAKNDVLQALLARKPKLDFFEACLAGDAAEVGRRLAADPMLAFEWSPTGWSALHFAAFSGNAEVTRLVLAQGAPIDARAKNRFHNTPLQVALLPGQYETAKLLLEHGADVRMRQHLGFAAIHEAAFLGRQDLVDLLLAHEAEINSRTDDGRTALTEARRGGYAELAKYLESKGAKGAEVDVDAIASPEGK